MKLRLVKHGLSSPREKLKRPPRDVPIIDTIRSWVREFRSTKADQSHSDFERLSNSRKT